VASATTVVSSVVHPHAKKSSRKHKAEAEHVKVHKRNILGRRHTSPLVGSLL
jgi:hypothetical protein